MFDRLDPTLTSLIVSVEESEAIAVCLKRLMDETGATHITEDAMQLLAAPEIDVIIEATGDPGIGIRVCQAAIAAGKHIVMVNVEADALAQKAGLDSVMDRCVKIEHARLFGGLHWAGVNTGVISAKRPV